MPIEQIRRSTAFITGGASGMGSASQKLRVARGAWDGLSDLRQDQIDGAMEQFAGGGQSNAASAMNLDVTNCDAYAGRPSRCEPVSAG